MGTAGMAGNPRCGRPGPTAEAVEFPFPFPAYTIQKQLMQEVYNTIEAGAVGIFESPTGTVRVAWCSALGKWAFVLLLVPSPCRPFTCCLTGKDSQFDL